MRNINFIERHFEKLAFGLVGLGMLAWVGLDLSSWGQGSVKMGGREVKMADVDVELGKKTRAIEDRQKGTEVPESLGLAASAAAGDEERDAAMTKIRSQAMQDASKLFEGGVAGNEPLRHGGRAVASRLFSGDLSGRERWYHEPRFGPVTMQSPVVQWEGCVSPEALVVKPAPKDDGTRDAEAQEKPSPLSEALAARQGWAPGDANVICTMPTAVVDLKSIRDEFKAADEKASPARAAVPASWRNGTITIVDVQFERQERQTDGSWGPVTLVPTLPGRKVLRGENPKDPSGIFEVMRSNPTLQKEILQPTFFPLSGGKAPDPSSSTEAAASAPIEERELRARLQKLEAERVKTEADLAAAGGEYRKPPKGGGQGGKGGGKGGGGGPGGGGPGGGATRPGNDDEASLRTRDRLTRKLDELKAQIKDIEQKLPKADAAPKPVDPSLSPGSVNLNTDDSMLVWTHDWTVRPDTEYRYRCRLAILNPFLGRARMLVKEQQKLDTEWGVDILTTDSNWVEVRSQAPSAFFVKGGAVDAGWSGLGASSVQVFRLSEGAWKNKLETSEPGDLIGTQISGRDTEPRSGTDWFVVAVLDDVAASMRGGREARDGKPVREGRERPILVVVAPMDRPALQIRHSAEDWNRTERRILETKAPVAETSDSGNASDKGGPKGG